MRATLIFVLGLGSLRCASGNVEAERADPTEDAGAEPDFGRLCDACETDGDCSEIDARCVGGFCGRRCGEDLAECPEGYECAEQQCVPARGDCTCVPEKEGAFRACEIDNDLGACGGIERCHAATGWGACQAVEPRPETCDGLDNDCDGAIDEELVLGTCGLGACRSAERCSEAPDSAELTCTPGAPLAEHDVDCNGADDDCDGEVDDDYEPFRCGLGVCAAESTCVDGHATCAEGTAALARDTTCNGIDEDCDGETDEDWSGSTCGMGICVRRETCSGADVLCTPGRAEAADAPEMSFEDSNCDGIDGDVADAIFVDGATGDDANDGSIDAPKRTIGAGIDAADGAGKDVYVSEGSYDEAVVLAEGVGLYGGYAAADGWSRATTNVVEITGSATAVWGSAIDSPTELQLLAIRATSLDAAGASSYGIFLRDSGGVVLTSLDVAAGDGADGVNGSDGSDGADGGDGTDGESGCENGGVGCRTCERPTAGAGGTSTCGRAGGAGGRPGLEERCGDDGAASANGTGGGEGGCDEDDGEAGTRGAAGRTGTNGDGGAAFGASSLFGYVTASGASGTNGTAGAGGGGGGGGGGGDSWCDSYGSGGGGGGAGGCLGARGLRGTGGGASFAVFLWDSTIEVTDCDLETGAGGDGGPGGTGGAGGAGGEPGAGGPYGNLDAQDDAGNGARGGAGGAGGRGGHGGGGGGGPTVGIECGGDSDLSHSAGNTFVLGAAGSGGGSSGQRGSTGLRSNTHGC